MQSTREWTTIWTCSHDAWQIHAGNGSIVTNDDYHDDHEALSEAALGEPSESMESWSAEITEVDPIHELLRVGDAVYCDGYGESVYVLRAN